MTADINLHVVKERGWQDAHESRRCGIILYLYAGRVFCPKVCLVVEAMAVDPRNAASLPMLRRLKPVSRSLIRKETHMVLDADRALLRAVRWQALPLYKVDQVFGWRLHGFMSSGSAAQPVQSREGQWLSWLWHGTRAELFQRR